MSRNKERFVLLAVVLALAVSCACSRSQQGDDRLVTDEDYSEARKTFSTRLVIEGPAPQDYTTEAVPEGVSEEEFVSGSIQLRGWLQRPKTMGRHPMPAVLFLHGGFAFSREDWEMTSPFLDAGFVVFAPVLRGENGLPGSFTLFYDEVDDVLAATRYLASLKDVDQQKIFVTGHSVGGTLSLLAAMASDKFRAAASMSGSPDQEEVLKGDWEDIVPFDKSDSKEYSMRSPLVFAKSFKCPVRMFVGSLESEFLDRTKQTASIAKGAGLDVEAVVLEGDHFTSVPEAISRSIEFFKSQV